MHAAEAITAIMITLAFFVTVLLSLFFYYRARHTEKMKMIENGYQPAEKKPKDNSLISLKWGVFFIGIAVGLFVGYLFAKFTEIDGVISFFSMILLFGGGSLIFNYYLEKKSRKKEVS